jgi:hypothetical protein
MEMGLDDLAFWVVEAVEYHNAMNRPPEGA